jgi:hypothetical protein
MKAKPGVITGLQDRPVWAESYLRVGGDGGESNSPSRRSTSKIYYKLIRAFNLALDARRSGRLTSGTTGYLRLRLPIVSRTAPRHFVAELPTHRGEMGVNVHC